MLIISLGAYIANSSESSNGEALNQVSTVLNQQLDEGGTIVVQAPAGFNVLSMSTGDMSSSSPWLRGEKMWIVSAAGGGILDQSASVRVTPSDAPVSGKDKPTSDFTLEIKEIKQTANYPIIRTYEDPIYHLEVRRWEQWGATCTYPKGVELTGSCPHWPLSNPIRTGSIGVYSGCGAICATPRASHIAKIENPTINSRIRTGVYGGKDGQSYESIIDSGTNVFERLGPESNPMGVVVWNGGTVTGLPTINQNDYKAIYVNEGSPGWRVIDKHVHADYASKLTSLEGSCICDWGMVECPSLPGVPCCKTYCYKSDSLDYLADQLNVYSNDVMNNFPSFGAVYQKSSVDNAKVVVEAAEGLWNNPVMTYYLKASWIGIYTPAPEAKIVQTGSACFQSGDENAEITVVVENIGDEHGNFHVSAQCPSPFSAGAGYTIGLDPGKQATVHLPLSGGSVSEKTLKECSIKVSSIAGDKTATQQVCIDPYIVCQANTKSCRDGRYLWQCNEFGTATTQIQDCDPNACKQDALGARCVDPNICNSNNVCESDLGETTNNCDDCSDFNFCTSCTTWLFDMFKDKEKRCVAKSMFETKCKWYDLSCHTHNMMVPKWTQAEFCPYAVGLVCLIILMFAVLIVILIKKRKGLLGKGGFKPKPKFNQCKVGETYSKGKCMPSSGVGWRGK